MMRKKVIGIGVLGFMVLAIMVVSAIQDPYPLTGYVKFENGTGCPGANITFTNQRTANFVYFTSVTNGAYSQDAGNIDGGYEEGDVINYYTVFGEYSNTTSHTIVVGGSCQMNIILDSGVAEGNASVTVTDGSITFGNLQLNAVKNTVDVGDTQSVNTTGADGAQKIEIKLNSSTVTGAANSTVLTFVSGSPGLNELLCHFKGGDVGAYTALTTVYQEFDNSMPAGSGANLDIQLTTPSSVGGDSYYDDYQFEIIVRATLL